MPRQTSKTIAIRYLEEKVQARAEAKLQRSIESDDDSVIDMMDRRWERLLAKTRKRRYLYRKKYRRRENKTFGLEDSVNLEETIKNGHFNDDEFLMTFRMSRESFAVLLDKVRDHKVFSRGKSKRARSACYQLLVFLYRSGLESSSGGNKRISVFFGIGAGTVGNYIANCMSAILCLKNQYIQWPNAEEKAGMKKRMSCAGFRHCVGIIDGTLVKLQLTPQDHPETYYSRKKFHALTVLVVCDDNAKVQYVYGGWPGSVHDNRMFKNCKLYQDRTYFFDILEYLLGDSAFSASAVMVQSFKKVRQQVSLDPQREQFNTSLAQVRIKSEHCIGMLKGRFQCLKSMNTSITKEKKSVKFVMDMFMCACVMHNILLELNHDEDNDQTIIQQYREDMAEHLDWSLFDEEEHDPCNVYDDAGDRREAVFQSIICNLQA